jgi:hypothetical protein
VDVYRQVAETATAQRAPGPIRIAIAVAQPMFAVGMPELDSDVELLALSEAVDVAGSHAEIVRIAANRFAIGVALELGEFDIVHISGHGHRGVLSLESWQGRVESVTAAELRQAAEAAPGAVAIVLSACFSASGSETEAQESVPGQPAGDVSLALGLVDAGAQGVIAMRDAVTDGFATSLCYSIYRRLAVGEETSLLGALSAARRDTAEDAIELSRSGNSVVLSEWATPVIYLASELSYQLDSGRSPARPPRMKSPESLLGVNLDHLKDTRYVSRPSIERSVRNFLMDEDETVGFFYGAAGAGKSTVVLNAILSGGYFIRFISSCIGRCDVDALLAGYAAALRTPSMTVTAQMVAEARMLAQRLEDRSRSWRERLDELLAFASHADQGCILLTWDDFQAVLVVHPERTIADSPVHVVEDEEIAEFIDVIQAAGRTRLKLLILSRYHYRVEARQGPAVTGFSVGALSRTKTERVVRRNLLGHSLPAAAMPPFWRIIGGNPRAAALYGSLLGKALENAAPERELDQLAIEQCIRETLSAIVGDARFEELLAALDPLEVRGAVIASVFRRAVPYGAFVWLTNRDVTADNSGALERLAKLGAIADHHEDPAERVIDWSREDLSDDLARHLAVDLPLYPWLRLTSAGISTVFLTLIALGMLAIDNDSEDDDPAGHRVLMPRWMATELSRLYATELRRAHEHALRYWMTHGRPTLPER